MSESLRDTSKIRLKVLSPAKINLFLFVGDRRPDGYHEVFFIAEKISIFDEILIESSKQNRVVFKGIWQIPKENTVKKALELLGISSYKITVTKRIPPGAGLGGGSSNAGVVIGALGKLNLLKRKKLFEVATKVGSDVPLFLYKSTDTLCKGRGEKVKPVKIQGGKRFYIVVYPKIDSSTKKVYSAFTPSPSRFEKMSSEVEKLLNQNSFKLKFSQIKDFLGINFLEDTVEKLYPKVKELKKELAGKFAKRCWITGTGSSVVCLFEDKEERDVQLRRIESEIKNVLVFPAESL